MKNILIFIIVFILFFFLKAYAASSCLNELENNSYEINKITKNYIYATKNNKVKVFHKILCFPVFNYDEATSKNCRSELKQQGYSIKKDYITYLEVTKNGEVSVFNSIFCTEYSHLKKYDSYKIISDTDYIIVSKSNKYGILTGWQNVPAEFDKIYRVSENDKYSDYFIVIKDNKYGLYYYDIEILRPEYKKITPVEDLYLIGVDKFICEKENKKHYCEINKEYNYSEELISLPKISYSEYDIPSKTIKNIHLPSLNCILSFWFWPANILYCQGG